MRVSVLRSPAKQRERDEIAARLRQAHAQDPRLGRALGRLHRTWERRRLALEGEQEALLDRCWWRRQERAEALRVASAENFSSRNGQCKNQ